MAGLNRLMDKYGPPEAQKKADSNAQQHTEPAVKQTWSTPHSSQRPDTGPRFHSRTETGEMTGTFGRERSAAANRSQPTRPAPRRKEMPPFFRDLAERLPDQWGVDLALLLITLVGIIVIFCNWSAVMLALARLIYTIANALIQIIILLLILLLAFGFFFGGRRR